MYYQNFFGDQDASRDDDLFDCFVELDAHRNALEPEYFSVRAFKGSGKTAFLRQLKHCAKKPDDCKYKDRSVGCPLSKKMCEEQEIYFIIPVDVTSISFETLYALTSGLNQREELTAMLRSLLKLSLVCFLYDHDSKLEKNDEYDAFAQCILSMGGYTYYSEVINHALKRAGVVNAALKGSSDKISNILFGDDVTLDNLYGSARGLLKSTNAKAILVLDKFDHVIDLFMRAEQEKVFYHNTIATSLLSMCYGDDHDGNKDFWNDESVDVKILFPEDLYSAIHPRDLQKYDKHALSLRWDYDSLKHFLAKRVSKLTGYDLRREDQVDTCLEEFVDGKLFNSYYHMTEKPFEYLLRHTLFKPRDLQELCVGITGELINKKKIADKDIFVKSLPPGVSVIKEGVRKGCMQIVKYLKIEFQVMDLGGILATLHGRANFMSYGDLYNLLAKSRLNVRGVEPKEIINQLVNIGVFGLYKEGGNILHQTYRTQKICQYRNTNYVTLFSFSWDESIEVGIDDELVIAPLFYDSLDLSVDAERPVYPF